MRFSRLSVRDPRTVARDIPGVLDILFPRLTGGLVNALNAKMFSFSGISPIPSEIIERSRLQKAMMFELSMARAESELRGGAVASWDECLAVASKRQRRHFDARIPEKLEPSDILVADHAARNLVAMLNSVGAQRPSAILEHAPLIPGLGWVASGNGDFAIGSTLIEVKHAEHNFGAGDFRQVLMYWLLRYARTVESNSEIWSDVLLLNPRRNAGLLVDFDHLLRSASASSNRVELVELLRSAVGQEFDRR
ncbi:hypothetical protein [Roseococcus pinisoli]|uniref:Uncharacterized protein n=1 Tax=Roseococcus pinisoli TaxID=2835040 RepID=A0ABS5QF27_9PROT|nr:hypothetical protein [Roseococcus pinisoli]MBS7811973.1 hypothetical protein [Roseococcus pinisoli]